MIYMYLVRHSINKYPCILIHWTGSILLSVIQFRKCHHVQIIETASILHVQCMGDNGHVHDMTTVLVQLGQAQLVHYSYSELNYVSAKLILLLLVYRSSIHRLTVHCTGSDFSRSSVAIKRLCIMQLTLCYMFTPMPLV